MIDESKKVLSLLSISAKAGKLVSGGFMTEKSIQEGSAYLVIIASDASDNTKKKFLNKTKFYHIHCSIYSDSDKLGRAIGKEKRTTVAVLDEGLAKSILRIIGNIK
ncbi:MAG: ribosomal L7Ae/L30e/S12e/Gadd45 family protein [Lachnospiraceae bacterium]|nr:ribosomal L7Ae/L30e/S12e/Gadd45 family protein [Lachnospiraceae bacterium]